MKNGLSYFDRGGTVTDVVDDTPADTPAEQTITPLTGAAAKKAVLGPTETADLLANMQAMINSRQGPMASLNRGLERAAAWGSGGIQGPSAALNQLNQQQQAEEKSTFEMRQQMAAYRAAQAQQEADAKSVSNFMGGAPMGGFSYADLPPASKARVDMASPAQKRAVLDAELKMLSTEQTKNQYNPAALDRKEALIRNPNTGAIELREVNSFEYRDLQSKGLIVPASEMYGVGAKPPSSGAVPGAPAAGVTPATTAPKPTQSVVSKNFSNDEIDRLINTESSNKPYAINKETKAMGYGQFMPETLAMLHQKGYKFDPFDRDQTRSAIGNYLDDLVSKTGSKEKALGAYGGFITKDPTAYINKILQPSDVVKPATATTTTAPGIPDISKIRAERESEKTFRTKLAEGAATNAIEAEKEFRKTTEAKSVAERKTSAERVIQLVQQYPQSTGVLAKPGIANALFTIAREGINTPSGAIGIRAIEDALVLTMPGTSPAIIDARKEIAQNLARAALETSKLSQGQGAVSDYERSLFERVSGSLADTPQLLIKRQQMLVARADLDQKLGNMYRLSKVPGKPTDYEAFTTRPDVVKLIDQYEDQLKGILGSEINVGKKSAPAIPKYDAQKEARYQQWKQSQGTKQ